MSTNANLDPDPQILREDGPLFMQQDEDGTFKSRSVLISGDYGFAGSYWGLMLLGKHTFKSYFLFFNTQANVTS